MEVRFVKQTLPGNTFTEMSSAFSEIVWRPVYFDFRLSFE